MTIDPVLIIQAPAGALADQLAADPPPSLSSGAAVLEIGPTSAEGLLEPPSAGEIVLSIPSPATIRREPAEIRRVLAHHSSGTEPPVIVIQTAEELREEELSVLVEAARHGSRTAILRIIRTE